MPLVLSHRDGGLLNLVVYDKKRDRWRAEPQSTKVLPINEDDLKQSLSEQAGLKDDLAVYYRSSQTLDAKMAALKDLLDEDDGRDPVPKLEETSSRSVVSTSEGENELDHSANTHDDVSDSQEQTDVSSLADQCARISSELVRSELSGLRLPKLRELRRRLHAHAIVRQNRLRAVSKTVQALEKARASSEPQWIASREVSNGHWRIEFLAEEHLRNGNDPVATSAAECAVSVRAVDGKGLGVFAERDFAVGEVLWAEEPVLTIPDTTLQEEALKHTGVEREINALQKIFGEAFLKLSAETQSLLMSGHLHKCVSPDST